jgi:hypothetical protein
MARENRLFGGAALFGSAGLDTAGARFRLGGRLALLVLALAAGPAFGQDSSEKLEQESARQVAQQPARESAQASYETITLRGRVVWMAEALDRLFGIRSVPEAKERLLAIETPDGRLHPIVADIRGRSFRRDPRLRVDGEFLVRRYEGSPMVQVIRIYEISEQGKFELDYWCEICAIAMFELKPCDCCQGSIELRRRKAASD